MNQSRNLTKIYNLLIAVSIGIIVVCQLFKIMRWPYGSEVRLLNILFLALITVFVWIRHYRKPSKNYFDRMGLFIVLLILSIHFNKFFLFTKMSALIYPLFLFSIVWLVLRIISGITKKNIGSNNIW